GAARARPPPREPKGERALRGRSPGRAGDRDRTGFPSPARLHANPLVGGLLQPGALRDGGGPRRSPRRRPRPLRRGAARLWPRAAGAPGRVREALRPPDPGRRGAPAARAPGPLSRPRRVDLLASGPRALPLRPARVSHGVVLVPLRPQGPALPQPDALADHRDGPGSGGPRRPGGTRAAGRPLRPGPPQR